MNCNSELIIYTTEDGLTKVDVTFDNDTVWLSLDQMASLGKTYQVDYYNLDVIISVGYRVKSKRGVQFRIWASEILKEYMKKGFAMDDTRLKRLGGGGILAVTTGYQF